MTTTYDRPGTRLRPASAGTGSGGSPSQISPEQRLVMQYLHEVGRARKHEHEALLQLKAALGQLAAGGTPYAPTSHAASSYAYVPGERVARERPRQRAGRGRLVIVLAVVLLFTGWLVFRGDDESASSTMPAGHDMSKMGSNSAGADKVTSGQQIDIKLGEFFVKPSYKKVSSGSVTFDVSNDGNADHEFMIASLDDLPQEDVENMSSADVHTKVIASKHGITAGSSGNSVTADLEPGKYLVFCNLSGHYSQGQYVIIEAV